MYVILYTISALIFLFVLFIFSGHLITSAFQEISVSILALMSILAFVGAVLSSSLSRIELLLKRIAGPEPEKTASEEKKEPLITRPQGP